MQIIMQSVFLQFVLRQSWRRIYIYQICQNMSPIKIFSMQIILKTVVLKKEIVKFDNSVSVVKSQCYSNANQIELVL